MSKYKLAAFFVTFFLLAFVHSSAQNTDRIGKWHIKIDPSGNESYHFSNQIINHTSEKIFQYTIIFVPHKEVTSWDMEKGNYDICCEEGFEEYRFEITLRDDLIAVRK